MLKTIRSNYFVIALFLTLSLPGASSFGNDDTIPSPPSLLTLGPAPTPTECSTPQACYDIVYVRYPAADGPTEGLSVIPQGESAYSIKFGADLMLRKADGSKEVLVDCSEDTAASGVCSVMDPYISYDGSTVYYSKVEIADGVGIYFWEYFTDRAKESAAPASIYKMNLEDRVPIRLTYPDDFDSGLFKGNQDDSGVLKPSNTLRRHRYVRDMVPVPLADGRLLFTSNRSALVTFHPRTNAVNSGSIQQFYVMDDHDGSATTAELANLRQLEAGNLHLVQHPMQLKDSRILFSTWQDVATKNGSQFTYAMTPLFTMNPDGSNLKQFTEPHDHAKNVEHFATQLSSGDVVSTIYYPGNNYGFGTLNKYELDPVGDIDFIRGYRDQTFPHDGYRISRREFDRKNTVTITPHTTPGDSPAPDSSGRYSMPSATKDDALLVAYSSGSVNFFDAACNKPGNYLCAALKSGIYLMPKVSGDSADFITDPTTQLVKIEDDPNYNEIFPRAVLKYSEIYGQEKPDQKKILSESEPDDARLQRGEAHALVGTSSMYNRESLEDGEPKDPFQSGSDRRELHDGNWTVQGAEAGVFTNNDIYGVRIVATPPIPFTKPVDRTSAGVIRPEWAEIKRHLLDDRLDDVVAQFGSYHGERWEVLGEFPVKKTTTDDQGNPDTSWLAKVPADTPFLLQTIDSKGMTLTSELTWRALKAGEKRADCGGCHAHSIAPLKFTTTEAGKQKPIVNIPNVADNDPVIQQGLWDLTQNKIPLLADSGVEFKPGYSVGVEFNRDVLPILNSRCVSCHTASGTGNTLILDGVGLDNDAWAVISNPINPLTGDDYHPPQRSKYIRIPQARQSLLVWVAWGERLDGRLDSDRSNDVDYPTAHPAIPGITDDEKRTIARWVDLGGAIDFPQADGFAYTDDYQLPIIAGNVDLVAKKIHVGFSDAKSGIDLASLNVSYNLLTSNSGTITEGASQIIPVNVDTDVNSEGVLVLNLPAGMTTGNNYVVKINIKDITGNQAKTALKFKLL